MRCHADRTRAQSTHLPTTASPPAGGAAAHSETEKDDVYCPAKRPDSQMDGKSSVKSSPRVEPVFPFLDLKAQFDDIRDEVMEAVSRVLEDQRFILGQEVESLENEIAAMIGARAAVACASGSDALLLSLQALGIGPGDEVITTPLTFVATAGSVARAGARPVFIDIRPDTFNLDPNLIEAAIAAQTAPSCPVNFFGLAAALVPFLKVPRSPARPGSEVPAQATAAA